MKVSDRTIGYLFVLFLVIVVILVAFGMWKAHHATVYTATVDFPELGALEPEAKVTVNGFEVGVVRDVKWLGDRARVTLQFYEPQLLREGTEIYNVNYALMGQRRIEIYPSKTGKYLNADYVFSGIFEPGIAEALKLMEEVVKQIENVRQIILLVANGDDKNPSFTDVFETSMKKIETLLNQTESMAKELPGTVHNALSVADSASFTIVSLTSKTEKILKTLDSLATDKIGMAGNALAVVSQKATQADSVLTFVENSPVGKLLQNDSLIQKTDALIKATQNLIAALNTKGLDIRDKDGNKVPLITWKNTNIFGKTAREKAKERNEKR